MSTTTAEQSGDRTGHMPQLDSLRAFAVAGVVFHHYVLPNPSGNLGVKLFFVLSGFLITGILLKARDSMPETGRGLRRALTTFYVRRTLRIFPLYYAVVFAALLADLGQARELALWLLTYTINFKMIALGWFVNHFAHLWSLAVEEQFYLFWPCVVLLVPKRRLMAAALAMVAAAVLTRLAYAIGWSFFDLGASLGFYISTPACFDSLGIGALLAIVTQSDGSGSETVRFLQRAALPVGVTGLALALAAKVLVPRLLFDAVFLDLFVAILFAVGVYWAGKGVDGPIGRVLNLKVLRYVGKISYGVYVYHPLVPLLTAAAFARIGLPALSTAWTAVINTVLTLLIAAISWTVFEGPINRLKDRLAPSGEAPRPARLSVAEGDA